MKEKSIKQATTNVKQTKTITTAKDINIPWWVAAVFFTILTAVFFWQQISGAAFFWEDFAEYVYPVQSLAAKEFANGNIPFWNPYSFAGSPFIADIQVGFFYPFNRLLSLFVSSDGSLPVSILQLMTILHFIIAQLSMFFLSRHFKVSSIGSIIAAVSYAFSSVLVSHVIHPMIVSHLSWLPLILMFMSKGLESAKIKYGLLSGVIFGITMLSGHPPMTLYIALFLGLFLVWNIIADFKKGTFKELSLVKYIIAGALPFLIALGIFQIQFLPSQEFAKLSKRNVMTYEKAAEGSLEIPQIMTAIVPKLFGYSEADNQSDVPFYLKQTKSDGSKIEAPYFYYWETGFYFGIVALILGMFAMINSPKDRKVAFFIAISAFALVFALGSNGFLLGIFHNLPFFSQFRNPARMMFVVVLAFSFLSGFGFDRLAESREIKSLYKLLAASALPILISILTASGLMGDLVGADSKFSVEISSFGISALVATIFTVLISFAVYKKMLPTIVSGLALSLVVFVDLYVVGVDFNASSQSIAQQYTLPAETIKAFRAEDPNNLYRVNMRMYSPSYMAMKRNQGMISSIQLLEGYNPLFLERSVPAQNTKEGIHRLFNVKYEIAIDSMRGMPFFYERTNSFPRAWFVGGAIVKNEKEIDGYMRNSGVDFAQTVVVEEPLPFELPEKDTTAYGKVKILKYTANEILLEAEANKKGFVSISEIHYPAWKAKVNGKEVKVLRSNYCLRAVPVEKGKSKIEMYYDSDAYSTGKTISLLTLLLSAVGLFVFFKKDI